MFRDASLSILLIIFIYLIAKIIFSLSLAELKYLITITVFIYGLYKVLEWHYR